MPIPPGYIIRYIKGTKRLLRDPDYPVRQNIDSGNWEDDNNPDVKEFVSDTELYEEQDERKRQRDEENAKREAEIANEQNKRSKKPRRKAIGNYKFGDTIELDGKKYKVIGYESVSKNNEKLAAWYVIDENGKWWRIDRFGDITEK